MKHTCRINKAEVSGPEIFLRLRLTDHRVSLTCRSLATEAIGHEGAFEKALIGSVRRLDLVLHRATWLPADSDGESHADLPFIEQPDPGSNRTRIGGVVVDTMAASARVDSGPVLEVDFVPNLPPPTGTPIVAEGELYAWPRDARLLGEAFGRPDLFFPGRSELVVKASADLTDGEVNEMALLLSRAYTDGPHLLERSPEARRARETGLRLIHSPNPAERRPLGQDGLSWFPSIRQVWGRRCLGVTPTATHVMLKSSGWLLSQATLIPRPMRFGPAATTPIELSLADGMAGDELTVASVEDVATDPEARGLGFGRQVVQRLADEARPAGFELAMLATGSPRFYAALGWRPWTGPAFWSAGKRLEPMASWPLMALALTPEAERRLDEWLAGPINVGDGLF
ncbi:MAG: GNAT family N-acetyltransferase [Bacillota bacterium]